jgi:nucleoside-diphosphate-sugar epimerase
LEQIGNAEQVYHLAGWVGFDRADREAMANVNITGTANVVNACLQSGNTRLCHVSSIAALGETVDGGPADETRLWVEGSSASVYAHTKFHGEMEVWRGIYEGLPAVIVNPSVITGPGMWEGPAKSLLRQLEKGLPFYPTGTSGYVDVRDVIHCMVSLMDANLTGERYIVSAENLSHRDVIGFIAEILHKPMPTRQLTPGIIRLGAAAERVRSLLTGTRPRFSKESLSVSLSKSAYNSQKIAHTLSLHFMPVRESVQAALRQYLATSG